VGCRASKLGEMYAAVARDAYKPVEKAALSCHQDPAA
jgi:hypothetical protein